MLLQFGSQMGLCRLFLAAVFISLGPPLWKERIELSDTDVQSVQAGLTRPLSCWAALPGCSHLPAFTCHSLIIMTSPLKLLRILPSKYLHFCLIPLCLISYLTKGYNLLFSPFRAMQISEASTPFPVIPYIWASNKFLWRLWITYFVVLNFSLLHSQTKRENSYLT